MRALIWTSLLLVGATAASAASVKPSQNPCRRLEGQPAPVWYEDGNHPRFNDRFWCPADAKGSWRVELYIVQGAERSLWYQEKAGSLTPRVRPAEDKIHVEWNRPICRTALRGDPSDTLPPPPGAKLSFDGPIGEIRNVFTLPLEVVLTGHDDLAPLTHTWRTSVQCPACPAREGMSVRLTGVSSGARTPPPLEIAIDVDEKHFNCAKGHSADLEMRFYRHHDFHTVLNVKEPFFVVPISLKSIAQLPRKGGKIAGTLSVDKQRLCAGKPEYLAWEVHGWGELLKGDSGRSHNRGRGVICR